MPLKQKLPTSELAAASPGEVMASQARLGVGVGSGGRKVISGVGKAHCEGAASRICTTSWLWV